MGRKKSPEKIAERYQDRVDRTRQTIAAEIRRGNLEAALRVALGHCERIALESATAESVYMLQFKPGHLSTQAHDKLREAWRAVVTDAFCELGLFMEEAR